MNNTRGMGPDSEPDLERWIEAFRGPLLGLIASWGNDRGTAEELAQEVFAEAWLARARFHGDPEDLQAVGAWLRGFALNLSRNAGRKRARRMQRLEVEPAGPVPETDHRTEALQRALGELPQPQQTVLRMFYLESSSAREVAALLGISVKAVEERLARARNELRSRAARHIAIAGDGVEA